MTLVTLSPFLVVLLVFLLLGISYVVFRFIKTQIRKSSMRKDNNLDLYVVMLDCTENKKTFFFKL